MPEYINLLDCHPQVELPYIQFQFIAALNRYQQLMKMNNIIKNNTQQSLIIFRNSLLNVTQSS